MSQGFGRKKAALNISENVLNYFNKLYYHKRYPLS